MAVNKEFDLSEYNDKNVRSLSCLVCSLPLPKLRWVEQQAIIERRPLEDIAEELDGLVTVANIKDHLTKCVVDRKVSIPSAKLLDNLMINLDSFGEMLQSYHLSVSDDMTPDSIEAYRGLFEEIRKTTTTLMKLETPTQQALDIRKKVLNPLIMGTMQAFTGELENFRAVIMPSVNPTSRNQVDDKVKEMLLSVGTQLKKRLDLALTKLAEFYGVKEEDMK